MLSQQALRKTDRDKPPSFRRLASDHEFSFKLSATTSARQRPFDTFPYSRSRFANEYCLDSDSPLTSRLKSLLHCRFGYLSISTGLNLSTYYLQTQIGRESTWSTSKGRYKSVRASLGSADPFNPYSQVSRIQWQDRSSLNLLRISRRGTRPVNGIVPTDHISSLKFTSSKRFGI